MKIKIKSYLAGRMGDNPNDQTWREEMEDFLNTLDIVALNPYKLEPAQLRGLKPRQLPDGVKHWTELRNTGNPNDRKRFLKYMRKIIRFDVNVVRNRADFIIVLWDNGCRDGAGSASELTIAFLIGKPVYCVEKYELPAWAHACCEKVFKSFDELKAFLREEFGPNEEADEIDSKDLIR